MLNDPKAIAIISKARQGKVAQPNRTSVDFERIIAAFFRDHVFTGELVLDLGPGQYDIARGVRERGGIVHNIDFDPAVVELGRYLGFECLQCDLKKFDPVRDGSPTIAGPGMYDGLFCKGSLNAFWFSLDHGDQLEAQVRRLNSLLKPGGWGWIAPWNGGDKCDMADPTVQQHLRRQVATFQDCGWTAYDLSEPLAAHYRMKWAVGNHVLFLRNLPEPPDPPGLSACVLPRADFPCEQSSASPDLTEASSWLTRANHAARRWISRLARSGR